MSRNATALTRPVTVFYASGSVPLLRLVTKELLERKTAGVRVVTGLVSPGEMAVETGGVGAGARVEGRRERKVR